MPQSQKLLVSKLILDAFLKHPLNQEEHDIEKKEGKVWGMGLEMIPSK